MTRPTELTVDEIRRAAASVAQAEGYRLVVLFGSAARGGSAGVEDLDLAILGRCLLDTIGATNRLIRELGVQEVDVTDLCRADALLMALVARDGIPLYESSPGEFARFASLAARRFADTRKFRDMERREILERVGRGSELS